MAYFSNGTSGDAYEHSICRHCIHYARDEIQEPCMVWSMHIVWNYDQCDSEPTAELLGSLIPRKGTKNGVCTMWLPAPDVEPKAVEKILKYEKAFNALDVQGNEVSS